MQEPAPPIIALDDVPPAEQGWGRPKIFVVMWMLAETLFITNPLQFSSGLRTLVLRLFGAQIGHRVVFRARTRVRFPWNLTIGDSCWIGEGVWISNRAPVVIEHDCVISQETFITTGSHAHKTDMRVTTRPVQVRAGAWVTSRCIVLGGSTIGESALIEPGTVVRGEVPPNVIWGVQRRPEAVGRRFPTQ